MLFQDQTRIPVGDRAHLEDFGSQRLPTRVLVYKLYRQ